MYVYLRLSAPALADEGYYHGGSHDDYRGEGRGFEEAFEKRVEKSERLVKLGKIPDTGCASGSLVSVARR
jgi:hypothetical protein